MGYCSRAGKPSVCNQPTRSTQPSTLCGMVNEYQLSGWVIINGDAGCGFLTAFKWAYGSSLSARSKGQQPSGLWHCSAFIVWTGWTLAMTMSHDDSTMNTVLVMIIIFISLLSPIIQSATPTTNYCILHSADSSLYYVIVVSNNTTGPITVCMQLKLV